MTVSLSCIFTIQVEVHNERFDKRAVVARNVVGFVNTFFIVCGCLIGVVCLGLVERERGDWVVCMERGRVIGKCGGREGDWEVWREGG